MTAARLVFLCLEGVGFVLEKANAPGVRWGYTVAALVAARIASWIPAQFQPQGPEWASL